MISLRRKIGYGFGDMGLSVSYFTVGFFFLYYLTDIVSLKPYLAGIAWFVGQAWDSINDPLMGAISDHTLSRFGRKRVYLLFGALPFAVSFILMWMVPLGGSQTAKFIFATVAILVYTTFYSLILVPYQALVPVITNDYDERTQIIGIRAILSTIGTLVGGGAAMLVSSFSSELTGLRVMALSFAIVLLITVFISGHSVRGLEKPSETKIIPPLGYRKFYLKLMRDRNVLALMSFKFMGAIATGALMAALPYFAKHILGDEGYSTIGLAIYITVAAVCIPIWNRLTRHFDKRRLLLIAMMILALILLFTGFFVSEQSAIAFYISCALMGTVMSAYMLIAFSFPPDLVDYYEHVSGGRYESLIFGLWLIIHQLGIAFAGLFIGMFLQVFHYNSALTEQTGSTLWAIRIALGVLPGAAMISAVMILQRYSITRKTFEGIRQTLENRGQANPGA